MLYLESITALGAGIVSARRISFGACLRVRRRVAQPGRAPVRDTAEPKHLESNSLIRRCFSNRDPDENLLRRIPLLSPNSECSDGIGLILNE
jgi:hypothetical protein